MAANNDVGGTATINTLVLDASNRFQAALTAATHQVQLAQELE